MFDWTLHIIETGGYAGIFFLMVLENIFPPIPSEVIIPLAGYAAAAGEMNIFLVILVVSLGTVAGVLPWYILGRMFGIKRLKRLSLRYGRALTLTPEDIDAAEVWFHRYGRKAVLFGRMIPTIRTLISVPAGIAKMPVWSFLLYSFIGSLLWSTLLALTGYFLQSQHDKIGNYLDPISNAIVALIFATYFYRVITFKKKWDE